MAFHIPTTPGEAVSWWVPVALGVVSILFGLATLFWPGLTLFTLIVLFGAFTLISGVVELVAMFKAMGAHRTWWTHLLLGLIDIAAGLFVLANPGLGAVALVYVIGFWAITIGVMEIIAAFTTGQFLLVVAAVIPILVGFVLIANPIAGALAYLMVIGVFAIVRGIILVIRGISAPVATPAA